LVLGPCFKMVDFNTRCCESICCGKAGLVIGMCWVLVLCMLCYQLFGANTCSGFVITATTAICTCCFGIGIVPVSGVE
jgi:hypothetical protein